MKLGSRDVTRIKQARARKAETERRMSIVQPRFGDVEDDVSELPQSIPRVPQQDLLNETSSVSHEDYAAEEQYAGYVQQTTVSGPAAAAADAGCQGRVPRAHRMDTRRALGPAVVSQP